MQTRQQVFCEIKDHIMLIRVDNPETKNGLDWDGIEQLARSYEELQNNPDVRVGIITGNEQYFYTGGPRGPQRPGRERQVYRRPDAFFEGIRRRDQADDRRRQRRLHESGHGGAGTVRFRCGA